MKRDKERDRSLILLLIMMFVILMTALFLYLQVRTDKMSDAVKSGAIVPVLMVVVDEDKPLLSELFLFYPDTGKGALLDVPGNTGSIITEYNKVDRIDVLFQSKEVEPFKEKVGELTELTIPFHYVISLENLKNLVDLIDGLDLFIANPVDTEVDGQRFLLPSGSVTLDGSKTVSYLKYTLDGESDAERIDRYQKFMTSLLEKMAQNRDLLIHDDMYAFLKDKAMVNMDKKAYENFLFYLSKLDMDRLQYNKILGMKRFVDNQELLFPHYNEALLKEMVRQINDYLINVQSLSDQGIAYSVEILNGTDVNGLASRTSQVLKSFGYKIAGTDNANRTDGKEFENTVVLDRKGNPGAAEGLAALIKCERWYSEADASLDDTIDITLILGKDFNGRYVK